MEKNSSTQVPRSTATRFLGIACAVLVATTMTACGLAKVGYRNGDTVGMFMLDRYLDLSSEQADFIKPRLHQLLVWHRTTQLKEYVVFLQGLKSRTARPLTTAEVQAVTEEGRTYAMATIDHAVPDLAAIATILTPDNVRALQKRFEDDSAKWRREFMKGDEERQRKARYERTLERVEEWYGRFSRDQRDRIRALSDARPFNNGIVIAERERRQHELVALLTKVEREKPPRDAIVAMLTGYVERFERNPDPDRRAFLEGYRHATEEMDAAIHNLSTPQQRAHAEKKLQEWVDDFRSLAADPNA